MKQKTDERLQNVKIKYGGTNIEDKKFILPILELLQEFHTIVGDKKAERGMVK